MKVGDLVRWRSNRSEVELGLIVDTLDRDIKVAEVYQKTVEIGWWDMRDWIIVEEST